jgi:hypothetical protein
MTKQLLVSLLTLWIATNSHAAMVRVVSIEKGPLLVVDNNGERETIRLAGVSVTEELAARELLRWTIDGSWLMIERDPAGGYLAWRSPDALFINRELVLRGFATATAPGILPEPRPIVTYLGVIDPPQYQPSSKPAATPKAKAPPAAKIKAAPAPKSGSRTSRRPPKRPSPKAKSRTASKSD